MRRVYIIAADKKVTQIVRNNAILNNCPEIAIGIPPVFKDKVGALPCVFEEPDQPQIETPVSLEEEIKLLKDRLNTLEQK